MTPWQFEETSQNLFPLLFRILQQYWLEMMMMSYEFDSLFHKVLPSESCEYVDKFEE